MKLFSDCLGECCLCSCGDVCLAGHGDGDFHLASMEQIIKRLAKGRYKSYTQTMKDHLKHVYGYDYDKRIGEYVELDYKLYSLVGCHMDELVEKFAAGYTLTPPEPPKN